MLLLEALFLGEMKHSNCSSFNVKSWQTLCMAFFLAGRYRVMVMGFSFYPGIHCGYFFLGGIVQRDCVIGFIFSPSIQCIWSFFLGRMVQGDGLIVMGFTFSPGIKCWRS